MCHKNTLGRRGLKTQLLEQYNLTVHFCSLVKEKLKSIIKHCLIQAEEGVTVISPKLSNGYPENVKQNIAMLYIIHDVTRI